MDKKSKEVLTNVVVSVLFLSILTAEAFLWKGKSLVVALGFFVVAMCIIIAKFRDMHKGRSIVGLLSLLVVGLLFGLIPSSSIVGEYFRVVILIGLGCVIGMILPKIVGFAFIIILGLVILGVSIGSRSPEGKPSQTVVLQQVDVKSENNIYISLEEGGIFKVSSKVAKDWDYHAGDTVKVVIYDDKIISCEK